MLGPCLGDLIERQRDNGNTRKDGHAGAQPSLYIRHNVRHSLISVVLIDLAVVVRIGHLGHELTEELGKTRAVFGFELLKALNIAFDDLGLDRKSVV